MTGKVLDSVSSPGATLWVRCGSQVQSLLGARGNVRALCALRGILGVLVWLHLKPFLKRMGEGIAYSDVFYDPWVSWYPEASRSVYFAILILACITATCMVVGLWSRVVTPMTFVLLAYNLFLSETFFRHNRHFLLVFLGCLSFVDTGRAFALDVWIRRWRGKPALDVRDVPLWPLWMLRGLAVIPYFASGFSKALDPDWRSGVVTWDRVLRYRHHVQGSVAEGIPFVEGLVARASTLEFHSFFAPLAIGTELFLSVGLLWNPTRRLAMVVAFLFHLSIELSASVQVFSYLGMAAVLIWVSPKKT